MPITRYATHLKLRGEYEKYMELLESSFNASTLDQVMCRNLISIGWEGTIYDCDFNQMLELPIRDAEGKAFNISTLSCRSSATLAGHDGRSLLRLHRGLGK